MWRILQRLKGKLIICNHVGRNARRKARWSGLLSSLSPGRDPVLGNVNCKSCVSSNKDVYCYPTACVYDRTFSLRSSAEHAAASSRVLTCFPFASTFVFRVPAAWLVLPFLLVDVFGIVFIHLYGQREVMKVKFPVPVNTLWTAREHRLGRKSLSAVFR